MAVENSTERAIGAIREDQTRRIVEWLRRTGEPPMMVGRDASGQIVYGPSCATRAADAIERQFGAGAAA